MNVWAKLSSINVNEYTEKKNKLTYLSWAWAWGIVKENYPDASYRVINFDGKPYLWDEHLGYLVMTEVTIQGETLPMHLFVMDGANNAQKHIDYEYKTKYETKVCEAATMFDINKTIMRCLTKNLAMFGLGHYIYAGEDLPQESEEARLAELRSYEKELDMARNHDLEFLKQVWNNIPKKYQPLLVEIKDNVKQSLSKPA